MRRNSGVLLIVFLILSFSFRGEELNELVSSLQQKGYSITSYQADLFSEGKVEGSTLTTKGKILFQEGKGLKVVGEVNWGKRGKSTQTVLVTPSEFIIYNSLLKRGTRVDLNKVKEKMKEKFDTINPMVRFDLRNPFILGGLDPKSLKLEGEGKMDGKEAYIFSATFHANPTIGVKSKPYSGKFWVDKSNGILLKTVLLEKGKEVYTITYTDIRINTEISDEEFTFHPPKDAKMIDVTQSWLKK